MPVEYRVDGNQKVSMAGVPLTNKRSVLSGLARTLTNEDSGALCLWSTAAGYTYTLPTAAPGLWFDFLVTTTITSSAAKFITASSAEFLLGTIMQSTDGTFVTAPVDANGTTIRAVSMNGTTTSGYKGDIIHIVGISATQWAVYGFIAATGTEATPFSTT